MRRICKEAARPYRGVIFLKMHVMAKEKLDIISTPCSIDKQQHVRDGRNLRDGYHVQLRLLLEVVLR
jgi:hypothetical protein